MHSCERRLLAPVRVVRRAVADYASVVGAARVDELRARAAPLSGLRVLHLTAASRGTRDTRYVRELMQLLPDLGIACDWLALHDSHEVGLAGALREELTRPGAAMSAAAWSRWISLNFRVARDLAGHWDVCVVHDIALAGVAAIAVERGGVWLRCAHGDVTTRHSDAASRLAEYDDAHACAIVERSDETLVATTDRACVIAPAIDPLAPVRVGLDAGTRDAACDGIGVDPRRPLALAVAAGGISQGVLDAVEAYRICRREGSDLQLAVVLRDAVRGGPAAARALTAAHADPDLHVLATLAGSELNALRSSALLVVAPDDRDGLECEVIEAIWKQRPVAVRRADSAPAGLREATIVIGGGARSLSHAILELTRDLRPAGERARAGHRVVCEQFLLPRLALDWLALLDEVTAGGAGVTPVPTARAERR